MRYALIGLLIAFVVEVLVVALTEGEAADKNLITLTDQNTVILNMPIDGDTAKTVQQQLLALGNGRGPLYLFLNSPGGSITDGQHIIELAKGLPRKIDTITLFSASMSFIISQYLGKRYILSNGVMMSHRAYADGLSGQVPGNLLSRALGLLESILLMENDIAVRAGHTPEVYSNMIKDELWMGSGKAMALGFADSTVIVRCGASLQGVADPVIYNLGFFSAKVSWHKCPLITDPVSIELAGDVNEDARQKFELAVYHKRRWASQYGSKTLVGE